MRGPWVAFDNFIGFLMSYSTVRKTSDLDIQLSNIFIEDSMNSINKNRWNQKLGRIN